MVTPAPIGQRYGKRTVIGTASPGWQASKGWRPKMLVRCDCGDERAIYLHDLKRGFANRCLACSHIRPLAGAGVPDPEPVDEARRGERCGYRAECPADGHASCRYYLDRYDLCALTAADLGGLPAHTVGELMGVTRQAVLDTVDRALLRRTTRLRVIDNAGFEQGRSSVGSPGRMIRKGTAT